MIAAADKLGVGPMDQVSNSHRIVSALDCSIFRALGIQHMVAVETVVSFSHLECQGCQITQACAMQRSKSVVKVPGKRRRYTLVLNVKQVSDKVPGITGTETLYPAFQCLRAAHESISGEDHCQPAPKFGETGHSQGRLLLIKLSTVAYNKCTRVGPIERYVAGSSITVILSKVQRAFQPGFLT